MTQPASLPVSAASPMVTDRALLTVLNDPARRAMYELLAQQAGVRVVQAEGALHALTQLERTKVDAIICDASMPDMTGAEFCSVIEGDHSSRNLPVYLIPSPSADEDSRKYVSVTAGPEILANAFRKLGLDHSRLPAPLNSSAQSQLDGSVQPFGLAEFLNWVAELGFSGHWLIYIHPKVGGKHTAHIAMNRGKVVYAEFGGRAGKQAILHLMRHIERHPQAEFRFYQSEDLPLGQTEEFTQSTARLLIELAVDLDESSVKPN